MIDIRIRIVQLPEHNRRKEYVRIGVRIYKNVIAFGKLHFLKEVL